MKLVAALAFAGLASVCLTGEVQALPMAPGVLVGAAQAPIVDAAVMVTKTVRRGPMGRRVVTKRVVRRGPLGGRRVVTTRTVR